MGPWLALRNAAMKTAGFLALVVGMLLPAPGGQGDTVNPLRKQGRE